MPELISSTVRRGVLGMGHTGRSVARYWKAQGIPFIAMDTRADLANDLTLRRELEGVEAYFGEISESVLKQVDLLIASPGIAMDSAVIGLAQSLNIEVRGDIDLFVGEAQAPDHRYYGLQRKIDSDNLCGTVAHLVWSQCLDWWELGDTSA